MSAKDKEENGVDAEKETIIPERVREETRKT